MPRINREITVTAGTPVNVYTGLATAYVGPAVYVSRIFLQMEHGGTGYGIVIDGVPAGQVAAAATHGVTAEMAPATATSPGGTYGDNEPNAGRTGIDVTLLWVDGSHSGDKILTSYVPLV